MILLIHIDKMQENANIPKIKKKVPLLIKILAGFNFICALFLFISFFSIIIDNQFEILVFIIAIMITLGGTILFFFAGRGLLKAKNYARIMNIIFAILGFIITICLILLVAKLNLIIQEANQNVDANITNLMSMFRVNVFLPKAIISLVVNFLIALYLLIDKQVKETFK